MLPILRQAVASTDSSLFVVLHMYGSHMDYTKRYPKDFAFFTPDDASAVNRETKDKVRNAYDNSIRYTDYVLDQSFPYSTARMPLRPFSSAPIMART